MNSDVEMGEDRTAAAAGFNLIGHFSANLGLGVVARSIARLMLAKGVAITIFNIDAGFGREGIEQPIDAPSVDRLEALPHAINLIILAGVSLVRFLDEQGTFLARRRSVNAAINFWELPTLPPRWIASLDRLDAIVAMSEFVAASHRFALSGPAVVDGRTPIDMPRDVAADRPRFGLPADAVVYVTSFEPHSDPVRKNPAAVVKAFLEVATSEQTIWLVVKINNPAEIDGSTHPFVAELTALCAAHPRILVLCERMSYATVLSLYASCDVFVSLHRAEGLGLGMAEAMLLGKPVIATGWSGNLTFMNHRNACLVGYRLVPVRQDSGSYRASELDESTAWAEPVVADAEGWMRLLAGDAALRARIGAVARTDMTRYNTAANEGGFIDELRELAWQRRRLLATDALPRESAASEVLGSNRLARLQALERELAWIKSRPSYRVIERFKRAIKSVLRRMAA